MYCLAKCAIRLVGRKKWGIGGPGLIDVALIVVLKPFFALYPRVSMSSRK